MPADGPTRIMTTVPDDVPRTIVAQPSTGDKIFRGILRASGWSVFVITGLILVFLILRAAKAFKFMGFAFLTTSAWITQSPLHFGIASILPFGILIALIAMVIAVPTGIAIALYISEYAPPRLKRPLISLIDLMAAIPSIIFGLWGLFFLMPRILGLESWLGRHLGFYNPSPALASNYANSTFIAGVVVSLMVIPIVTSLSRQVFSQAPVGEREGAYALGSTRWGMVRTVVLPFGRGGVIGATMLGLGRALGETIAVTLIIVPAWHFSFNPLQSGSNSIASRIAVDFASYPDAGSMGLSALMAAGLVLFGMTLIVNTLGAIVIGRSRSGQATG
jgi:phosphate transport system permease protein